MTQTLTTDELRQIVDSHEKGYGMSVPINYGYLAARELLANREAQPVGFTYYSYMCELKNSGVVHAWLRRDGDDPDFNVKLYTAPPAPADQKCECSSIDYCDSCMRKMSAPSAPAVPDETDLDSARTAVGFNRYIQAGYVDGWNACRAAMLGQPVSSGYKLVPVEPTPEMWDAGSMCYQSPACIYHAMLAAAPEGGN